MMSPPRGTQAIEVVAGGGSYENLGGAIATLNIPGIVGQAVSQDYPDKISSLTQATGHSLKWECTITDDGIQFFSREVPAIFGAKHKPGKCTAGFIGFDSISLFIWMPHASR